MIREMRHVGIVVRDMDRSVRFWRDVMGLKVAIDFWEQGTYIETLQALKGVKLRMVKLTAPDESMVELLYDEGHPTEPPERNRLCDRGIRHIAFTVADVEAAWRTMVAENCEVLSKPVTSPDGKARLFFARDPEGNLLELVQMIAK